MSGMRITITKEELVKHVHHTAVSGLVQKRTLELQAVGATQLIVKEGEFKSVKDLTAEIDAQESEIIKQGAKLNQARAAAAESAKEKSDKSTTRRSSFLAKKPPKSPEEEMVEHEEAIQQKLMQDIGVLKARRAAMKALEDLAIRYGFGDDIDGLKKAYIYQAIEDKRVVPDGAQIKTDLDGKFSDAVHYLIHELIGLNVLKTEYSQGVWKFTVKSPDGHDQTFEISSDPNSTKYIKKLEDVLYAALLKHHAIIQLDVDKDLLKNIDELLAELTKIKGPGTPDSGLAKLQDRVASRLKSPTSSAAKKSPAKAAAVGPEIIALIAAFSEIDKGKQYTYQSVKHDDSGQMTKIICTDSKGDEHMFLLSDDNKTWAQEYSYGNDERDEKDRAKLYAYYDVSTKTGSNFIAFDDRPEELYQVKKIENSKHQTIITYLKGNEIKTYHGHDFLGGFHGDEPGKSSAGDFFDTFGDSDHSQGSTSSPKAKTR